MVTAVPKKKQKAVRVTVNVSNTGQLVSSTPVVVSTLPATPSNRLDSLTDVDATAEVESGVPVYDADTDKYKVGKLALGDLDLSEGIDGGSF